VSDWIKMRILVREEYETDGTRTVLGPSTRKRYGQTKEDEENEGLDAYRPVPPASDFVPCAASVGLHAKSELLLLDWVVVVFATWEGEWSMGMSAVSASVSVRCA
jgi:hypothetical protein